MLVILEFDPSLFDESFDFRLFADVFVPPILNIGKDILDSETWPLTMSLEIQFKAIPKGRWIGASQRSRFVKNGRYELDGEMWDEDGNLVAITR